MWYATHDGIESSIGVGTIVQALRTVARDRDTAVYTVRAVRPAKELGNMEKLIIAPIEHYDTEAEAQRAWDSNKFFRVVMRITKPKPGDMVPPQMNQAIINREDWVKYENGIAVEITLGRA